MTALPESDETLAAEYVLGVLDAADRALAETRIARDPAFADAVVRWQAHLAPLNDAYAPVVPPAALQGAIERRLFPVPDRPSLLARLRRRWPWLAGLTVAAAGLMVVLTLPLAERLGPPQLQATLAAQGAPVAFAAAWDGAAIRLTRTGGAAAAPDRDYQLWLIGPSGVPESLGVIDAPDYRVARAGLAPGLVLAVSVEPRGGAPGPAPTGPVILTAALSPP